KGAGEVGDAGRAVGCWRSEGVAQAPMTLILGRLCEERRRRSNPYFFSPEMDCFAAFRDMDRFAALAMTAKLLPAMTVSMTKSPAASAVPRSLLRCIRASTPALPWCPHLTAAAPDNLSPASRKTRWDFGSATDPA